MLKFQDENNAGVCREHIRSQGVSGISQKQFCTRNDLNHARFGYWKRRLAAGKAKKEFRRTRPAFSSCDRACRSPTLIFEDSISDGREP